MKEGQEATVVGRMAQEELVSLKNVQDRLLITDAHFQGLSDSQEQGRMCAIVLKSVHAKGMGSRVPAPLPPILALPCPSVALRRLQE